MDLAAVPNDGSSQAQSVIRALTTSGQCVPCLAAASGITELAVRAVLSTLKAGVVDQVNHCSTCGGRRLVYRAGSAYGARGTMSA
jgi:hypothetical protein